MTKALISARVTEVIIIVILNPENRDEESIMINRRKVMDCHSRQSRLRNDKKQIYRCKGARLKIVKLNYNVRV
ncbi:MAG: hypothetical protein HGB11_07920 [Chlorobiales bacterium]|nr:hypothetical protein [Chlorobiales bacterium]